MRDVDASPEKDNNKADMQAQAKGAVEVARGAASKKDLTKHNNQKQDLPRVRKPASKDALDAMLEGGEPIEFGTTPDRELCSGAAITLGSLVCSEGDFTGISQEADGHTFKIQYTRPPRRRSSTGEMTSDDAAMLVRAFLLARISTTRAEVRGTLETLSKWRKEHNAAKGNVNQLLSLLGKIESDHGHSANEGHQPKLDRLEHALASTADSVQKFIGAHKIALYVLIGIVLVLALRWVWMPAGGIHPSEAFTLSLAAVFLVAAVVFSLCALNLKTLDQRIEEKSYEKTSEKLAALMATLAQTNLNVASSNIRLAEKDNPESNLDVVSESLLCEMDSALQLKERLMSIERVIKAREEHLNNGYKHIAEHRDRVRRTVTAAGSGIFVGFFTYEVGESIVEYLHVTHQQDSRAMLHWLVANEMQRPATAAHSVAAVPMSQQFNDTFHRPEVVGHSALLTITLVVSLLTAWIAMRKPPAEQAAGHGHH